MRYVLDTNVFIEAQNRYYSFDIVPAFWRTLIECAEDGQIISIDRVKKEIIDYKEDDELKNWIESKFDKWFMSTDNNEVFQSYSLLLDWAQNKKLSNNENERQYTHSALSEFASKADSWLIAYAMTYNYVVVTHEQHSPESRSSIKIPNACHAFGISYVNSFEMLRRLKVKIG